MSTIYTLPITANTGYSKDRTPAPITVADLIEVLQGLDQDGLIVTLDDGNTYGACFGTIHLNQFEDTNN